MHNVEVAYATPMRSEVIALSVAEGTTIEQAIIQSSIQVHFPEINLKVQRVGVFGELRGLTELVKSGDRIEIYRPLKQDPMVSRQQKVKQVRQLNRRRRFQSRDRA